MDKFVIKGGSPLVGEVEIGGAKNAALAILTAAIMTDEPVTVENIPDVSDINVMLEAISVIGATTERIDRHTVRINGSTIGSISVDYEFIKKILDDAYEDGLNYDVSDMEDALIEFALGSHNNAAYCLSVVHQMKLKSAIMPEPVEESIIDKIVFFDCEVFPNLFLINWKFEGADNKVVRMINPSAEEVQMLTEHKLVGFNCRRYDNHILYARILGENNEQLYHRSQAIISGDRSAFFGDAFNLSYTDIFDFSSKKQSLKKFEIELAKEHDERIQSGPCGRWRRGL